MPPIYYGSAPFALKRGSQALNLYYGSTLISGGASIGGVNIGDAGTGIYTGYVLSDGDEFRTLSIVSPQQPTADYFSTRAYRGNGNPGAGLRAPASGALAVMHDVDPYYTGWQDSNRGTPIGFDSHSIVTGEGSSALRLHSIRQTAGEQVYLNTGVGGQVERGSMVHSAGRLWFNSPCVLEWRARIPQGPAGQHPTLWALSTMPPGNASDGNEYGFEGSGAQQEAYQIVWSGGTPTGQAGTLASTYRDGNYHTFTVILGATDFKYYVDGSLVHTIAVDPDTAGSNKADYWLASNHVYNASFMGQSYSAAEWAADADGVDIDIEWVRVWHPSAGAHYVPQTIISDVLVAEGGAVSIVLPSQSTLWGATGLTEYVCALPNEVEEPGGTNTASYAQFPAGLSYNSGTRTLSGTLPAKSGALYIAVGVVNDGCTTKPARFRICAAPKWNGASSYAWTDGVAITPVDVYAGFDVGRLFQSGSNPKGLSVTGLPSGLSFSSSTGLITGTPAGVSSGSITVSSTNSAGQVTSSAPTFSVSAASSGGVAAPTLTGSPALAASWDFDNGGSLSVPDGSVTTANGVDGTAFAIANTGTNRPALTLRDGKNTAQFTAASSQFLQVANSLGVTGACTFVAIMEPSSTAATQTVCDLSNGANSFTTNHHTITASTSTGYSHRKNDGAASQSIAAQGSAYGAGKRLLIGVSPSGASSTSSLHVDGVATPITGTPASGVPASLTHFTLGARRESNAEFAYASSYVWRVLVYSAALNATQLEEVAVWAASNYGTTNNA